MPPPPPGVGQVSLAKPNHSWCRVKAGGTDTAVPWETGPCVRVLEGVPPVFLPPGDGMGVSGLWPLPDPAHQLPLAPVDVGAGWAGAADIPWLLAGLLQGHERESMCAANSGLYIL